MQSDKNCSHDSIYLLFLGLWVLIPITPKSVTTFSTIFQFYQWRKPEYLEKTTNLSQVTHNLYYIKLYLLYLTISGIKLTILVTIDTFCVGNLTTIQIRTPSHNFSDSRHVCVGNLTTIQLLPKHPFFYLSNLIIWHLLFM
jgi:hypothetical protein